MPAMISVSSKKRKGSWFTSAFLPMVPILVVPAAVIGVTMTQLRALADKPAKTKASAKAVKPNGKTGAKKTVTVKKSSGAKTAAVKTPVVTDPYAKMDDFVLQRLMNLPTGEAAHRSQVIVKLHGAGLTPARRASLSLVGGEVHRDLPLIQSAALSVPTKNLEKLASLPFVTRVSMDAVVKKNDEFTVESSGADSAFTHYGLTGRGVGVAVLDTGIADHADFSGNRGSRIVAEANFVANDRGRVKKNDADDECGHGTHIAGIIAGNGAESDGRTCFRTFYGVAREASLVNVRVLNEQGEASVSTVISGISWAIENRNRYNIRVMNVSFGHAVGESYKTDPLCQAVEAAWKSGIVVVCAAGNGGRANATQAANRDNEGYGTAYGSIQSPGNSPYVITVGAMKQGTGASSPDRIATYSSRGPSRIDLVQKPDLVAAGNAVIAPLSGENAYLVTHFDGSNRVPNSAYRRNGNNRASKDYMRLSGTSMAAPVVSGAAALLLQKYPNLSPDSVKARLMMTASKWSHPNGTQDICTYGAGYVNIPAALNANFTATVPALSPTLSRTASGTVFVNGEHILVPMNGGLSPFGTGKVGGLQAIWGGNALTLDNTVISDASLGAAPVWSDRQQWSILSTSVDLSSVTTRGDE